MGGLYTRPEALQAISPTFIGWRSITTNAEGNPTGWKPDGQRFEVATSNYPLLKGLQAAIEYQHQWGNAEQRYHRICQLSQMLWSKLGELPNLRMVRQTPPDSGLVSFWVLVNGEPSPAMHKALVEDLEAQGVFSANAAVSQLCAGLRALPDAGVGSASAGANYPNNGAKVDGQIAVIPSPARNLSPFLRQNSTFGLGQGLDLNYQHLVIAGKPD